jgi:hypothetical protein
LGRPLVAGQDHTAFFGETVLSNSDIVKLMHGELYVNIDNGAALGRILLMDARRP